ncbi:uncharacterized protein LOC135372821 [Ornithodoros turicata]|uniref:uncharacterized protein LOC135372821 n=1 Tax=Ornithodoros turicata TaxID=34597 RepID=UPI003138DA68
MYVHVKYEDEVEAILPVSKIRNFHPTSLNDFNPSQIVYAYWRNASGDVEDYYPAKIAMLKESVQELAKTLTAMHKAVPEIFKDEEGDPKPPSQQGLSQEHKAANIRTARNRGLKRILETHKENKSCDGSSELAALRKENEVLQKQLAETRSLLERERELCHQINMALLKKLAMTECVRCAPADAAPRASEFRNLRAAFQVVDNDGQADVPDNHDRGDYTIRAEAANADGHAGHHVNFDSRVCSRLLAEQLSGDSQLMLLIRNC